MGGMVCTLYSLLVGAKNFRKVFAEGLEIFIWLGGSIVGGVILLGVRSQNFEGKFKNCITQY